MLKRQILLYILITYLKFENKATSSWFCSLSHKNLSTAFNSLQKYNFNKFNDARNVLFTKSKIILVSFFHILNNLNANNQKYSKIKD